MSDKDRKEKTDTIYTPLNTIAKRLKAQPLIFIFGVAIILLAAGTFALENLRLILGGLLILAVLGLAAISYQGRKVHHREAADVNLHFTEAKESEIVGRIGKSKGNVKVSLFGSKISGSRIVGSEQDLLPPRPWPEADDKKKSRHH
jgi:hypothetical protein